MTLALMPFLLVRIAKELARIAAELVFRLLVMEAVFPAIEALFELMAATTEVRSVEPPLLPEAKIAAALLVILMTLALIAAEPVEILSSLVSISPLLVLIATELVLILTMLLLTLFEFALMAATTEVRSVEPPPLPAAGIAAALLAMLMAPVLIAAELVLMLF